MQISGSATPKKQTKATNACTSAPSRWNSANPASQPWGTASSAWKQIELRWWKAAFYGALSPPVAPYGAQSIYIYAHMYTYIYIYTKNISKESSKNHQNY